MFTFFSNSSDSIGAGCKTPRGDRGDRWRAFFWRKTDLHIRRFVAGILSDCGHAVETCADAGEAASSLATRAIDVVVTDLVFEFAGDTTLAHDCAARGIPTLTLSGSKFQPPQLPTDRQPGLREKPFRFADLQRVIEAVAAQRGPISGGEPRPAGAASAFGEAWRQA